MSGKRKRKLKPIISAAHKEKNPKMTMECEICRSKFSTKIILMQHIQLMHLETRQKFPCQICNTILLSEKDLKTHISLVHEEKKPFKCGMCKSKFSENKSLNRHMTKKQRCDGSVILLFRIQFRVRPSRKKTLIHIQPSIKKTRIRFYT